MGAGRGGGEVKAWAGRGGGEAEDVKALAVRGKCEYSLCSSISIELFFDLFINPVSYFPDVPENFIVAEPYHRNAEIFQLSRAV